MISTKAGYDMWPGPYGQGGGSRKYVLASLDQSLARMGLDYVDIFYSHRFDAETPVEETMMALDTAVRSGQGAVRRHLVVLRRRRRAEAATIARELGTPLLIHQPSYSMLNRWIESDLLDELEEQGMGCIVFTALAQGLLTDRYLDGVPADSRAARERLDHRGGPRRRRRSSTCGRSTRSPQARGQKLAQLALQWALRDPRVTSAVIGASSVEQLDTNLDALDGPPLTDDELAAIDQYAVDSGINLWAEQTEDSPRAADAAGLGAGARSAAQPEHRVVSVGRELLPVAVDLPAGLGPVRRDDRRALLDRHLRGAVRREVALLPQPEGARGAYVAHPLRLAAGGDDVQGAAVLDRDHRDLLRHTGTAACHLQGVDAPEGALHGQLVEDLDGQGWWLEVGHGSSWHGTWSPGGGSRHVGVAAE